jgi:Translin family
MRRAINNISTRQGKVIAVEICLTLRQIQSAFQGIYVPFTTRGFGGDFSSKIEVMKASVSKIENACYNNHVRGSEKPEGWTMDVKEDGYKRVDREMNDEDEFGRGKRRRLNDD